MKGAKMAITKIKAKRLARRLEGRNRKSYPLGKGIPGRPSRKKRQPPKKASSIYLRYGKNPKTMAGREVVKFGADGKLFPAITSLAIRVKTERELARLISPGDYVLHCAHSSWRSWYLYRYISVGESLKFPPYVIQKRSARPTDVGFYKLNSEIFSRTEEGKKVFLFCNTDHLCDRFDTLEKVPYER